MKRWKFPHYTPGMPLPWALWMQDFPWLSDMQEVPQDPLWHAEGDVYVHTQMVLEALVNLSEFKDLAPQDQHVLVAAALLHDVEKRSTTTRETIEGKERIVSPKHAKKGEYTARSLLYRDFPAPFPVRESIAKLVRLHGLPLWALEKGDSRKAVIEASTMVNTFLLYLIAKADVLGRVCQDQEELLLRLELFRELCLEHQCWNHAYPFASDYGRYIYLNREDIAPDYAPFNDLKSEVMVLCALPGTGKDTFLKRHWDGPILSLDALRREMGIGPTDKKGNGRVIQAASEQAKVWLRQGERFAFNATREIRSKWISLFVDYKAKVELTYLEVPYSTLLKQNHNRQHPVPQAVVERLIDKLEIPQVREAHTLHWEVRN